MRVAACDDERKHGIPGIDGVGQVLMYVVTAGTILRRARISAGITRGSLDSSVRICMISGRGIFFILTCSQDDLHTVPHCATISSDTPYGGPDKE